MFYKLLIAFTALTFAATSFAADSYRCTVRSASGLDGDGQLSTSAWTERYEDQEFVVDVETGRMIGGVTNANSFGEPEVLDPGSEEQSLKVITVYGPNVFVDYLIVRVFEEGLRKPFIFVTGETLLSGTCIEY